jgi:hypothetical protein
MDGIDNNATKKINETIPKIIEMVKNKLDILDPRKLVEMYEKVLPTYVTNIIKDLIKSIDEKKTKTDSLTGDDLLNHLNELQEQSSEKLTENPDYLWNTYDFLKSVFESHTCTRMQLPADLENIRTSDPTKITAKSLCEWIDKVQKNSTHFKFTVESVDNIIIPAVKSYIHELGVPDILLQRMHQINVWTDWHKKHEYVLTQPDLYNIIDATTTSKSPTLKKINSEHKLHNELIDIFPLIPEYYVNTFHALMQLAVSNVTNSTKSTYDRYKKVPLTLKLSSINTTTQYNPDEYLYNDVLVILSKTHMIKTDIYDLYCILSYLILHMNKLSDVMYDKITDTHDRKSKTQNLSSKTWPSLINIKYDKEVSLADLCVFHTCYMNLCAELNLFARLIIYFIDMINKNEVELEDDIKTALSINLKLLLILSLIVYTKYLDIICKYGKNSDGTTKQTRDDHYMTLEHVIDTKWLLHAYKTDTNIISFTEKYGVTHEILEQILNIKTELPSFVKINNKNNQIITLDSYHSVSYIEKAPHMQPILKLIDGIANIINCGTREDGHATINYITCVNAYMKKKVFDIETRNETYTKFVKSIDSFYTETVAKIADSKVFAGIKSLEHDKKPKRHEIHGGLLSNQMSTTDNIEDLQHKIKIISIILFCIMLVVIIAVISVIVYNLTAKKSYTVTFA